MTVLGLGSLCTFVPVIMMMMYSVYMAMQSKSLKLQSTIAESCTADIIESPIEGLSVTDLVLSCLNDNESFVNSSVLWAIIRCVIQVKSSKHRVNTRESFL